MRVLVCDFSLALPATPERQHLTSSMMLHFRKRFSEEDLKRIKELIAEQGRAMVIETVSSYLDDNDEPDDPGADAGKQASVDDFVKPADWPGARTAYHSPSMPSARQQTSPAQLI